MTTKDRSSGHTQPYESCIRCNIGGFPNNVMLVYAQHAKAYEDGQVSEPSPGYVAGFNTWKALGRSVVKGQHGYLVLAPLRGVSVVAVSEQDGKNVVRPLEKGETPAAGEQVETRPILRGFKVERVFSEHQTAGEPLPEHPTPKLLEGEAPVGLGEAVMGLIESQGVPGGHGARCRASARARTG